MTKVVTILLSVLSSSCYREHFPADPDKKPETSGDASMWSMAADAAKADDGGNARVDGDVVEWRDGSSVDPASPSKDCEYSDTCGTCRLSAIPMCPSELNAFRAACEVQYLCILSACDTSTYESLCSCAPSCLPIRGMCPDKWQRLTQCTEKNCGNAC